MYRVYDNKIKKFLRDGFYLAPNEDLFAKDKGFFNFHKLKLVPDHRYVWHKSIGLKDKNNNIIYEGDICKSDIGVIGVVAYAPEKASYLLFDYENEKYYPLTDKICNGFLEIIGNTFENSQFIINKKSDKTTSDPIEE